MFTEADRIQLAKEIAAAKRGEGPMPSLERLRAGVDSIRVKRAAVEVEKATTSRSRSTATSSSAPAQKPAQMEWGDLGF